jgi:hypothetical protein
MYFVDLVRRLPAFSAEDAGAWLAAAVAGARALRQHDDLLYPLGDDPAEAETARHLHAAWQRWADEAEALLAHVRSTDLTVDPGAYEDLRFLVGYARCLTKMPPEEIARRNRAVESGEAKLYTIEEARRELGLPPRAGRRVGPSPARPGAAGAGAR